MQCEVKIGFIAVKNNNIIPIPAPALALTIFVSKPSTDYLYKIFGQAAKNNFLLWLLLPFQIHSENIISIYFICCGAVWGTKFSSLNCVWLYATRLWLWLYGGALGLGLEICVCLLGLWFSLKCKALIKDILQKVLASGLHFKNNFIYGLWDTKI